jgi:type I restriction enzyme S subunit
MNWTKAKLANICKIEVGKTPSRKKTEYFGQGFTWLSIADMNGSLFVDKSKEQITEKAIADTKIKIVPANTVLYSFKLSIGKVNISKIPLYTNEAIAALIIKDQVELDTKFLYYTMRCQDFSHLGEKAVKGITLNKDKLSNLIITFPDILTQKNIVSFLDEADELRKADIRLMAQYDELVQASFFQLFGSVNEMIKQFPSKKLELVADIVSGVAKNTKAYKDNYIDVPYMRVANVQDGHINLDEVKTIKVSQQDFDKYLLQKDDILLTEGGDPDKLGRGAVWHNEISPCIHQNHIFRVRTNKKELNPAYLSFHIGSGYGKRYFLKAAKQTTGIASINMTQLKNFDVIIPPLALQNKFAEIAAAIEEQRSIVQKQQQQSEDLFQSLLQKAFKGNL